MITKVLLTHTHGITNSYIKTNTRRSTGTIINTNTKNGKSHNNSYNTKQLSFSADVYLIPPYTLNWFYVLL